jgi:hypothetical protein
MIHIYINIYIYIHTHVYVCVFYVSGNLLVIILVNDVLVCMGYNHSIFLLHVHLKEACYFYHCMSAKLKRYHERRCNWHTRYVYSTYVMFKAVPLQAWSVPEGSSKLSFPEYMTTAQDGGKVVSLTHRPSLPPENAAGTHFC